MTKNLFAMVLALGLFTAFAGAEQARADKLLIERHSYSYDYAGTNFHFDASQGTAWMEVRLTEDLGTPADLPGHGGPGFRHEDHPVQVPGLSYDAAAAQILFTGTMGKVVCATVTEKNSVFGTKWLITLTGSCRTYTVTENHGVSVYFEAK